MSAKILPFVGKSAVSKSEPDPKPEPNKHVVLRLGLRVVATEDGFMVLHFVDDQAKKDFGCDGILVDNTSDVLEQIVKLIGPAP